MWMGPARITSGQRRSGRDLPHFVRAVLLRVARVLLSRLMSQRITQRELRNDSGRVMRALDKGKSFIVTRNGVPVGELIPLRQRVFVPVEAALAAFAGAPRLRS